MPNRTAKILSAIAAGCVACTALTGVSRGATPTPAADECLSGPTKDQAPSGSHWYYRIDRTTKRHCWYLGPQRDARAQTAPANTASIAPSKAAPSTASAAPKAEAAMPGTVVNARAELTASQTRSAQAASATGQVPSGAPADGASANAGNPDAQRSLIATRWPDQLAANDQDASESQGDSSAANAQTQSATPQPPAAPVAAAPAADTSLGAADASSAKQSGSISTLLIVIAGALALAGLVGSAIVRFGGRWPGRNRETENDRSAMWGAVRADHQSRPNFQIPIGSEPVGIKLSPRHSGEIRAAGALRAANAPRAASISRLAGAPRAASDPDDKIAEMLARLARSAQS